MSSPSWVYPLISALIYLCGSAQHAIAEDVYEISGVTESIELGEGLPYLQSAKGELDISQVINSPRSQWETWGEGAINFAYTDQDHWVSFELHNRSSESTQRFLTYGYPLIDELELFFVDERGEVSRSLMLGDRAPFKQRPILNRNFVIPIELRPGERARVITRMWSTEALWAPIHLWEPHAFYLADTQEVMLRGLYYGIVFIMALYNLFVFLSIRERSYLLYSCFVTFLMLYQAAEYGFAYQYLWPESPWWSEKSLNMFTSGSVLLALLFTISFLDLKGRPELTYRLCHWLRWVGVAIMSTSPFMPTRFNAIAVLVYVVIALPAMFIVGFKRVVEGSVEARYFLASWVFILVGNFTYVFTLLNYLPTNFLTVNAPQVGSGLEVILLSLGLGRKLKVLHDENLRIQTQAALNLQEKVEERTKALKAKTIEAQEATREAIERRHEAEELRRQAERHAETLEDLDRQKTHFFQNISHELRTPLTLIMNPLESSQRERPEDIDLQVALKNTRRLLSLVNQLLDFQRLEAGRRLLSLEPLNLSEFTLSCAAYVGPTCKNKEITFNIELPDEPLWVYGEVDALEKITFNLISNAIKFTPEGGEITLSLSEENHGARLAVRDNGVGIHPDEQGAIFDVFTQAQTSETREYEGSGLGLALARSLVHEMGGEIGVISDLGSGSEFWFMLDLCEASLESPSINLKGWALQPEGRAHLETDQVDDMLIQRPQYLVGSPDHSPDYSPDHSPDHSALILVIDDLSDMRDLIKRFLIKLDYRVITAASGERALQLLESNRPDLIITDWMMPKLSGPELIGALRADDRYSSIPTILLTAKSDPESKILGLESGADAFLGKPFNADELGSTVRNLISLKSREREVEALNSRLTEGILRRYLPDAMIDEVIAGSLSLTEEPHVASVTILFCDIAGFASLSQRLRAPKLAKILRRYLNEMIEVIFQHGGTIDKLIGDAIMVIFGSPTEYPAREQARRAADCAAAMHCRLADLNQLWLGVELEAPLEMRSGLHCGPVVVGMFGTARRADYTAIGPTVNLASSFRTLCQPGEAYLSGEVCDLLSTDEALFVDHVTIKGLGTALPIYKLASVKRSYAYSSEATGAQPVGAQLAAPYPIEPYPLYDSVIDEPVYD